MPPREIYASSHLSTVTLDVVGEILFAHDFHGLDAIEEWAERTIVDNNGVNSKLAQLSDPFLCSLLGTLRPGYITVVLIILKLDTLEGIVSPRSRQVRAALNRAANDIIARAAEQNTMNNLHAQSLLHLL